MIREILNQFDPSIPIEQALTPPSSWYTEKAMFDAEMNSVFLNTWQAVGHIGQLEKSGQYFTGELAGQPYMVLRDDEDHCRSYYNICRHHASTILHEAGHTQELVCPYHGWTYCLKGRLKRAPHLGAIENFRREDFGLLPIQYGQWDPLVFLHFGKPALSLAEHLLPLNGQLNLKDLRFIKRETYEISCN
jgi:choline monooxygenase